MGTRKRNKKKESKFAKAPRNMRHNERPYYAKIERIADNDVDFRYTKLVSLDKAKRLTSAFVIIGGVMRKKEDLGIPVEWQLVK